MTIHIDISDDQVRKLTELARVMGISIEDAARLAIERFDTSEGDGIEPEDPEFNKIADRVLAQNAELYRRLA